jgi:plasmid stability protein
MASLTLKNMPDDLLGRLRDRARVDRRSLTQEAFVLLESALDAGEERLARDVDAQVEAWQALAGRWRSDRTSAEEIADIVAARTEGREVHL